LIDDHMVVIAF